MPAARLSDALPHRAADPKSVPHRWGGLALILSFNLVVLAVLLCHAVPDYTRVVVDNLAQCLGPLAAFLWSLRGTWKKTGQTRWLTRRAPTFL